MDRYLDILEKYQSADTIDDLWIEFKLTINQYGFTSAIYGVGHSILSILEDGVENSLWYKCDHPEEYRNYFDEAFNIQDDPTAIHCFTHESQYVWHEYLGRDNLTEEQNRFMQESAEFGMGVGVTFPIRFGISGIGGIGMGAEDLSEKEFERIWKNHGSEIAQITNLFDQFARSQQVKGMYSLSKRETEVLTWLAVGKKTCEIAGKLGIATSTTEKYIRRAREKFGARNNEQAVAIALTFGLISL